MFRFIAPITALLACLYTQSAATQVNHDTDPIYQAARTKMSQGKGAEVFPIIKAAYNAGQINLLGNGAIPANPGHRFFGYLQEW